MDAIRYDDAMMRTLLETARVIAVVGYSPDPSRTSNQIGQYLMRVGYKVYAVNPTVSAIEGCDCYPSLAAVPEPIDIVNVFRRSIFLKGVVEESVAVGAKAVWAQLGVVDPEARQVGEAAGIPVIMNKCIKVEHRMLVS